LQQGYDAGFLLASGPQNPRSGGIIIGAFSDKESALDFTRADPFAKNSAAQYSVVEFSPVKHAPCVKHFLGA